MKYGKLPVVIATVPTVDCTEFMFYQYLPVKLAGVPGIQTGMEPRLKCFEDLVGTACCDYVALMGLDAFVASHVYITAKHGYESPTALQNRPGWHADGFLSDDINYVWSDKTPTVFNDSQFDLTLHDSISLGEMEAQAKHENDKTYDIGALLRIDQFVVHKVGTPAKAGNRTFLKISMSVDKYDLKGNSKNYALNYDWPVRERALSRNVPQSTKDAQS